MIEIVTSSDEIFDYPQRDDRSCLLKCYHWITSLFKEIISVFLMFFHKCFDAPKQLEWKKESQGLVVMLHGLACDPAVWHPQCVHLEKHKNTDVFAPHVPKWGLCSLEEAASPFLPVVLDYIEKYPNNPICFIGFSNGTRISLWLETQLREKSPNTAVMVSNIAGVHLGSGRVNQLDAFCLGKLLCSDKLKDELAYESDYAKELLDKVNSPLPKNCHRHFDFYATTEDLLVPNLDSCLPDICHQHNFYLHNGEGHISLVAKVAEHQIARCAQWMNNMKRAIAPIEISSERVTVESGTLSTVPIHAHRTLSPFFKALKTPKLPKLIKKIVAI